MALSEYTKRVDAVLALLRNKTVLIQNITVAAGRLLYANFVQRIFQKGLDANGAPIGQYSTKPAYFSPKQVGAAGVPKPRIALPKTRVSSGRRVPALTPVGKGGQKVFKNGRPHQTAYVRTGYSGFRKAYGRQNKTVDLNLTGSLFLSIQLGVTKNGVVLYFATLSEAEKGRANERRFARSIFAISKVERELFDKEVARILTVLINNIMSGKSKI